jgi:hypothetical protein
MLDQTFKSNGVAYHVVASQMKLALLRLLVSWSTCPLQGTSIRDKLVFNKFVPFSALVNLLLLPPPTTLWKIPLSQVLVDDLS